MKLLKRIKDDPKIFFKNIFYEVISWNWISILLTVISLQVTLSIFFHLHYYVVGLDTKKSLELILTINGLFSAILVTYFFNRISWILSTKKETLERAIGISQKITEFRRILNKLTLYYNAWVDDDATKNLLEVGKYQHIDYYDFKLMSYSEYEPKDKKLIDELNADAKYKEGLTDLFLGMISLVKNRKSRYVLPDGELYNDFQKRGIYGLNFIEKCVEIDHANRMAGWFKEEYSFINFHGIRREEVTYIKEACKRIDVKFSDKELDNKLMKELCEDMNEYYFKELYQLLLKLRLGLKRADILLYIVLMFSLSFGVFLPFWVYFILNNLIWQTIATKLLISINLGLLFFFIVNLYGFVKKEITWA